MLRDFRISELRTLLNRVTPSIHRKNLVSNACTCDRTLSVITPRFMFVGENGTKTALKIESFAFFDNSRFMTTEWC